MLLVFFVARAQGSCRVSAALPPSVRQVVLFSSGPWGERICVNAELIDANQIPITIGKLTPYNKYVHFNTTAPLADRELSGKRKRERTAEEDSDGGGETSKARGEENIYPNGVKEKTTPVRKVKGQAKSCQKLFANRADAFKANAAEDMSWVTAETLAQGPTPEARIGHTAVFDPDSKRIFVFGGSKNKKWFNDMHILDTKSWRWTMVEVCNDHSACVIQERYIYVFGGWDTPVCYSDMYMLDLETKFLIHGGYNGNNALSDTFIFDIGENQIKGQSCLLYALSVTCRHQQLLLTCGFLLSETDSWTELKLPQLSVPRAGHSIITMETPARRDPSEDEESMSSVSIRRTLLVFGGGDNEGNFFSDLTSVSVEELLDAA
ncbi:hypothetical protein GOODEAATRI_020596 [Goodea atripinnis]|uniref:Kelch repeat-containing protein n=1 Tax=Goodea atripinnis TaxID=208336 RepID=A0ABV0NC95_9TELE